jgi:hypothetical protein
MGHGSQIDIRLGRSGWDVHFNMQSEATNGFSFAT